MSTKVRVNLREMYPKYYNQDCFVEVDQDVYETMNKYDHIDAGNIDKILQDEIGEVFMHVLEDAGVYKQTQEGQKAFDRFTQTLA